MYNNPLTYKILVNYLSQELMEAVVIHIFSTGKSDLIFVFKTKEKQLFKLHCKFVNGEIFYFCDNEYQGPSSKSIPWFKQCENTVITNVQFFPYERIFALVTNTSNHIVFKGFGKFSNILLFEDLKQAPVQYFRINIRSDAEKLVENTLQFSGNLESTFRNFTELKKQYKFIPDAAAQIFSNANYYLKNANEQATFISNLFGQLNNISCKYENNTLEYILNENTINNTEAYTQLENYARDFSRNYFFETSKIQLLNERKKQLKLFTRLEKENSNKLILLEDKRSYKELGDLILSAAHTIKTGVSEPFIFDYYKNEYSRIKINPELSAAQNAEKFYKKAQNESMQKKFVEQHIIQSKLSIERLKKEISLIENAQSFSEIKLFINNKKNNQPETANKPYKEFEFNGFNIWVGKNNKSNDALLKLSNKNDMWMHARNASGSHVIIKKKGTIFPTEVLQFAANLAAKNSKEKTQKIVPVIYTIRKFVSKGKNAAPGEVHVIQEKVMDGFLEA